MFYEELRKVAGCDFSSGEPSLDAAATHIGASDFGANPDSLNRCCRNDFSVPQTPFWWNSSRVSAIMLGCSPETVPFKH